MGSLFLFGSGLAVAKEYKYQTLDQQNLTEWTVLDPESKAPPTSVEDSFKTLKVTKKSTALAEALKKRKNLSHPRTIAILGDTGCRLKESLTKTSYQDCSNPKEWRYQEVVASVAKENPDLIVHVGDYHYREQCSAGKPCQKMSPEVGYGWGPWKLDFFEPSEKAFGSTPWIIVRGNHEECKRAYLGYKMLLRTADWQADCEDFEPTQVIQLGELVIVNFDSSSVSEMPETSADAETLWKKRVEMIGEQLKPLKFKHLWIVTHKPVYGLVSLGPAYAPVNINLRKYLEASSWFKQVELIFAGHIHDSQIVRIKDQAIQVVLGNGGSSLDKSKGPVSSENLSSIGYDQSKLVFHGFGYGLVKGFGASDLSIEFHDSTGTKVFSCHFKDKAKDCF